ncbi:RNA polymerase sigma factor [Acidicapsa acidisoli]|uniref:RNA polymerase sigma factor n=1 Tax=Acidicapsa acidisoli TaxID=1615681 RepID=UPI0021DFE641|nr:sigma-70 family RNA polymerase sigma factor [Acidicapsa acidisoli]
MSGYSASEATEYQDRALVAAIAAGHIASESAFVLRYMPKVRTLLIVRSRNPELAMDLQQDVMIEALCALRKGQLRDAERLPAFVAGIARNVLNNHFRSQSRKPMQEELPEEIADTSRGNPLDSETSEERRQVAHQAIATLNDLDRSILQMTLVEDLKPGVIAERLGLSPDVVRQRKLRATRRVMEFVRRQSQTPHVDHRQTGERR